MSEANELVSNDRLVRELRLKIDELSRDFNKRFGKTSRSMDDRRFRNTRMRIDRNAEVSSHFYHKLQEFNIDKDNESELIEMDKNLARLKKSLDRRLKDLRTAREDYEIEDIASEIQRLFQTSPIMKRLLPQDLRQRIESLKYSPEMSKEQYISLIKSEINKINFERDSVRAVIIANSDPELKKTFDELLDCSTRIDEEVEYRDKQKDVTRRYNGLCHGYETLEKIEQELAEPNLSEERRNQLIALREKTLCDLRKVISNKRSISKEGRITVLKADFTKLLRSEIEDLAFQKNALNGIVDPNVVSKDKFIVEKLNSLENFDRLKNWKQVQDFRKKNNIVNENSDYDKYLKSIELKILMQELAITYQQKTERDKIRARLDELNKKTNLTPAELREKERLISELRNINSKINNISKVMDTIRKLGKELGIPCIVDGSLDLHSTEQLNSTGVAQVEVSMKKQKEQARQERKKVCEKYGVDSRLSNAEVYEGINKKVKEIQTKKRHRNIDLDYKKSQDMNAPQNTPNVTNSSVVPLNFEDGAPKKIPTTSVGNKGDAEKDDESYKEKKVVRAMQVYDVQTQLDTNDPRYKQRVEFGRVYRYEKGNKDGELLFVEEDLEVYLENPKKKLNEILDGLRDKVLDEFPNEKELENYCKTVKTEEFKGLVSKNPIKRAMAKKSLIKKLDEANPGKPAFGYINMAIALNSELLPDAIDETLGRCSQPYGKRESDMVKYVKIKGRSTILGNTEKGEVVRTRLSNLHIDSIHREEKYTPSIDLTTRNDGMVRPFEIKDAEMDRGTINHEEPVKTNEPQKTNEQKKSRSRNRNRKRKDKSQDGEIE